MKLSVFPSSIETIDQAYCDKISSLKIATMSNGGCLSVPVRWSGTELAFQRKYDLDLRDEQRTIVLPIITLKRLTISKNAQSKGAISANLDNNRFISVEISKKINSEKTSNFANADTFKKHGKINFPKKNNKIVYETVLLPHISYLQILYEAKIETEYQQQMNDILNKFLSFTGNLNAFIIENNGHKYEAFLQDDVSNENNIEYTEEQRIFVSKLIIKVYGYVTHTQYNENSPQIMTTENFVEFKIPKEKIIFNNKK